MPNGTQPLVLRYSVFLMAAIVSAGMNPVKCKIMYCDKTIRQTCDYISRQIGKQKDPTVGNPSGLVLLIPRKCRVLLSFEPAFAGGSRPRNAALAQAYRVISIGVRDPKCWCWLKTGCATSRTSQGQWFYTINTGAMVEKN